MNGISKLIKCRFNRPVSLYNTLFEQVVNMDKKSELLSGSCGNNIANRTRSCVRNLSTASQSGESGPADDKMPYIVGHDKKLKEFYIKLQDGNTVSNEKAILQYEWLRKNLVDLYHTEVPPIFRGKGIAQLLAEAAFEHFVAEDVTMKLTCSYLQHYAEKNPVPRIWSKLYSGD